MIGTSAAVPTAVVVGADTVWAVWVAPPVTEGAVVGANVVANVSSAVGVIPWKDIAEPVGITGSAATPACFSVSVIAGCPRSVTPPVANFCTLPPYAFFCSRNDFKWKSNWGKKSVIASGSGCSSITSFNVSFIAS